MKDEKIKVEKTPRTKNYFSIYVWKLFSSFWTSFRFFIIVNILFMDLNKSVE